MLEKALNLFYLHPLSFVSSFFLLIFLYKWLSTTSSKVQNLPPSPPKVPLFGHLPQLGTQPHRTLRSLSEQYGELMLLYLGKRPTLIVSSARVVKEIMKTHDVTFSNRAKLSINDKLIYNCKDVAACPYGEYWRQMKSIFMLQLLSNRRVKSFKNIREEETSLIVEKIQKNIGSVVNLSEMFATLTNDVICRVTFGRKYNDNQLRGVDFKWVITEFVELIGVFNVGDYIPWLGWVNRFNGLNARLEKCAKSFDLILEEIITEHSDVLKKYSDSETEFEAKDFVDVLLQFQKENSTGFALDRESIKGLIMRILYYIITCSS
ncbi:hypothetical protein BVRB_009250 [Beta vulgaris subsp. vulgaris]|uniref:Cytochrome P450 n=1 Tax=Beta vulgaris subsp. vulgaris TaxID=3555 RepID=A0A0J8B6B6_BETVV|nr:hypothetical protein BVRB_009250 [Beta vulgaris subsp. vulgaris]